MSNRLEICARHISFDLAHDWIDRISIENQSCEYALNTIFRNSQFCQHYKGYSDIVNAQNFKVNKVTCLKAVAGTSGSIIDTYGTGAEILRDNTNLHVLNRRGHDNDVVIEYRKNLTGLEVEEDTTDLVTRIMPYAIYTDEDSQEVEVRGDFVDSPLINNYAHPYVKYIDYSDKFENDEVPTKTKLNDLATKEYTVNHEPKIELPFEKEYEYICGKVNEDLTSSNTTVNNYMHIFISGFLLNGASIWFNSKYTKMYINGEEYTVICDENNVSLNGYEIICPKSNKKLIKKL